MTATVTITPIGGVAENTHVPTTLPNTPTPSPTTRPAVVVTNTPGGALPTPTSPASAATATRPAATTRPSTNTPRPPTATWVGTNEVYIYLIAVGDDGATGTKIGCGDSAIAVKRVLASATQAPLRAAITELLSIHDQNYGESGFYNALYQSSLTVSDVNISNRVAIVKLTGTLTQGGECDSPRIKAQLELTATQFTTVDSAQITINGTPIDDVLSLK
jgi:hypothetical protein